jgi:hypothetical protein
MSGEHGRTYTHHELAGMAFERGRAAYREQHQDEAQSGYATVDEFGVARRLLERIADDQRAASKRLETMEERLGDLDQALLAKGTRAWNDDEEPEGPPGALLRIEQAVAELLAATVGVDRSLEKWAELIEGLDRRTLALFSERGEPFVCDGCHGAGFLVVQMPALLARPGETRPRQVPCRACSATGRRDRIGEPWRDPDEAQTSQEV